VKFDGTGNIVYGTYLGGSDQDFPQGLATDSNGNVYLTGFTRSNDFPTLHAFQTTLHGEQDAFIAVLNSTGTALIYATYLGGAAGESGRAIGVDDAKNAYITGSTFSTDFPTVSPLQGALRGTADNVNPDVPATFIVSVTTTSRSLGMLRFPGLSRSTWLWAMATISLFVRPSVRREQAIDEP
jgi:hypothetical protein